MLTRTDLQKFVADPSTKSRVELAHELGGVVDGAAITEREREIAAEIFRLMARDAEVEVRAALAASLRASPKLPRDVALKLAADVDQVSLPLLEFSPALSDADLVAIIRAGGDTKQTAIARRDALSPTVASSIAEDAGPVAVTAMLANQTAMVSDAALATVLDRLGANEQVQVGLAHRPRLPVNVAERLVGLAGDSLQQYVVARHAVSPDVAADLVLRAREHATIGLSLASSEEDVQALVDSLHAGGRLTETLVTRALCTGDIDFFERALARIAGIPVTNAYALVHDPVGLQRLVARCGFSSGFLTTARAVIEIAHDLQLSGADQDRGGFAARMIERVLTQFAGETGADDSEYLLRRLAKLNESRSPTTG